MLEIDNRKVDLTEADHAKLGKSLRRISVYRNGGAWVRCSEDTYYQREEELRGICRREGVKFEAFLLFENGRVRV